MALGVISIQQAFRRYSLDHLRQLPSQIHRILHADVETLSAHRGMHVRGVAGQQNPSVAICSGLASHVGEPGDRGGTVDPVIGPVYGDERLADIVQRRFAAGLSCCSDSMTRIARRSSNLPIAWEPVESSRKPHAGSSVIRTSAISQLLVGSHPSEFDARCFTDYAASSVAADEIFPPQRRAVRQPNVDARVVLRETPTSRPR